MQQAVDAVARYGNETAAAMALNIPRQTFQGRVHEARRQGVKPGAGVVDVRDVSYMKAQVKRLETDLGIARKMADTQNDNLLVIKKLIHDGDVPRQPPKWLSMMTTGKNTGVPTLFASDWHYDEVVDPKQINGANAFNRVIANARIKRLFTKAVDLLIHHMNKPKYDYFVLDLGGDMLSGNIHEELRETNEAPVSQSLLAVIDQLIGGIDLLLKYFDKIIVNAVPGNHGRWDKKPRMKNRVYETYEWIGYQFLAKYYKDNPDVIFNISDGADLPYSIYTTRYLLTHGDQFKGGSGIAGALSPLMLGDARKRKRAIAIDQPFDYLVMGHWHQLMMVKGIIVNGSLKGADEYSFQSNFDFEPPQQALWVTHKDWGITARWPVLLAKPGEKF
jgi:hypothetical protein